VSHLTHMFFINKMECCRVHACVSYAETPSALYREPALTNSTAFCSCALHPISGPCRRFRHVLVFNPLHQNLLSVHRKPWDTFFLLWCTCNFPLLCVLFQKKGPVFVPGTFRRGILWTISPRMRQNTSCAPGTERPV
jgi:hypothetical protein